MMRHLFPILLLSLLSPLVRSQDAPLPNPPIGQVLDRKGWLGEARERSLEERLRRYRTEFGVDILVIIWDRDLPDDQSQAERARNLGKQWAREDLWALVLTQPESLQRPSVHYGGRIADSIEPESLAYAVEGAIDRGLKDWTDQARVEAVAMEIGEEFAYLNQRRTQELTVVREHMAEITARHEEVQRKKAFKLILASGALGITLATMVIFWLHRRRRGPFKFPETRWRKRFGGEWSGGSTIAATLPTTPS